MFQERLWHNNNTQISRIRLALIPYLSSLVYTSRIHAFLTNDRAVWRTSPSRLWKGLWRTIVLLNTLPVIVWRIILINIPKTTLNLRRKNHMTHTPLVLAKNGAKLTLKVKSTTPSLSRIMTDYGGPMCGAYHNQVLPRWIVTSDLGMS